MNRDESRAFYADIFAVLGELTPLRAECGVLCGGGIPQPAQRQRKGKIQPCAQHKAKHIQPSTRAFDQSAGTHAGLKQIPAEQRN